MLQWVKTIFITWPLGWPNLACQRLVILEEETTELETTLELLLTVAAELGKSVFDVNVCIHNFDDVKEKSNKAASNDKHLLQDCFNKQNLVSWFTKDQALP